MGVGLDVSVWLGREIYGIKIKEFVASGGISYILLGEVGDRKVAIKVMRERSPTGRLLALSRDAKVFSEFINEAVTLLYLRYGVPHASVPDEVREGREFILKCYGYLVPKFGYRSLEEYLRNPPSIILEFFSKRTLSDYLKAGIEEELNRRVLLKVAKALAYMHASGVMHGDVKPKNVLIGEGGEVRLIDPVRGLIKLRAGLGTVAYSDPLYLLGGTYSFQQDVFSLGLLTYQLASGGEYPLSAKVLIKASLRFRREGEKPLKGVKEAGKLGPLVERALRLVREGRMKELIHLGNMLLEYDVEAIPRELRQLVVRSLTLDKRLRFKNAVEFLRELRKVL